jgi:hypothetical protein
MPLLGSISMKILRSIVAPALIVTLVIGAVGRSQAQDNSYIKQTLSLASYYSNGDYGEDVETNILYFPISYTANFGKWGVQATVPHLRVNGIGNVLVNGVVTRARAETQRERNSGVGDSVLSLIYRTEPLSENSPFIDFRMDVKLPTADEKRGLGTGESDYTAQIDISQYFGSSVLFSTFGYTFRGKSDLYQGLKSSAFAQMGVAQPLNERWNIGLFYDYREAASSVSSEIHELVPYFSWQFSRNWSFTGLTAVGFTDGSASTAVLGQLSYSW